MRSTREHDAAGGRRAVDAGRRRVLAAGAAVATGVALPAARAGDRAAPTIDLHSHAGRVVLDRAGDDDRPFVPLAAPMRAGGMDVVCLAVVADTPVTRIEGGAIRAWRAPGPGELHAWALRAHDRARRLVVREGLRVVVDRATLDAAVDRPSIVVASEGADFLEGRLERVDEFRETFGLGLLQLTHYRPNELGDIQTAPAVHGRLTDFGARVVARCNALGIVVDVAHAPLAMVRGVVETATRPFVLSHTSLSRSPGPTSRLVSPEHARLVAASGGVIGVWPPASRFPSLAALAVGIRDLVDLVGVDHVGLGSDLLGLTGPSIFRGYADLPALQQALRETGFDAAEVARIVGGNAARVLRACLTG